MFELFPQDQLEVLSRVLIASVLGAIIGFEREVRNKPAGLRTYMLICASACLFVNLGTMIVEHYNQAVSPSIQSDPIRIMEAIVVGISFIGGGIIFKNKDTDTIKNLTTASLILYASIIGISVALDLIALAVSLTIFSLFISWILKIFEKKYIQ